MSLKKKKKKKNLVGNHWIRKLIRNPPVIKPCLLDAMSPASGLVKINLLHNVEPIRYFVRMIRVK